MNSLEDKLREACACGEEDKVTKILAQDVDFNNQHKINGWTPLHWAAKRGFVGVVKQLLDAGADTSIETQKGELALQLAEDQDVIALLGGDPSTPVKAKKESLPITPNYIANPIFPYGDSGDIDDSETKNSMYRVQDMSKFVRPQGSPFSSQTTGRIPMPDDNELVLKVRIANSIETDYIEIELDRDNLSYEDLITVMCEELKVERCLVHKVRKQPDTILRKDKDVRRLIDFQELELVLTSKAMSGSCKGFSTPTPKQETILY